MADNKVAIAFANTLLERASNKDIFIGHIKLQKLLYFAYAHYLVDNEDDKIADVKFQAWHYGPVIPEVYHNFKRFGDSIINEKVKHADGKVYTFSSDTFPNGINTIDFVLENYGQTPDFGLVEQTHKLGGAWDIAYKKGLSTPIDDADIRKDFKDAEK